MTQSTRSVSLEVRPGGLEPLKALIDGLHDRRPPGRQSDADDFAFYLRPIDTLHFMALTVFPSPEYEPLFVIEVNFDGPEGPFWDDLDRAIGGDLREMLRWCKRPLNGDGPAYDAAIAPGSVTVARYLERRASKPSVFHHGNRGMTRVRIGHEAALFEAARRELATVDDQGRSRYHNLPGADVHKTLRGAMLPGHGWLAEPAAARVPLAERAGDWGLLAAFAFALLFVLSLPGMIAAGLVNNLPLVIIIIAVGAALLWWGLYALRAPLEGTGTPGGGLLKLIWRYKLIIFAVLTAFIVLATLLVTAFNMAAVQVGWSDAWRPALRAVLFGLLVLVAIIIPGLVLWLRVLELNDSSQERPPIDAEVMRQMAQREDWRPQNHMGSVVLLRPGVLRTIIVHAGHRALHLALRATVINGYLGSMRTVHFAHWAFVNNAGRLMFLSNFDQSWESYLDDFIEKAADGLTLAWGCGVGFPPTRMLIQDGARHGRLFKAWARHSMAVSRFWYSAYPDLTVDQIERNNRIADGLRAATLDGKALSEWLDEL